MVTSPLETEEVWRQIARCQTCMNLSHDSLRLGPIHDSGCQVDHISKRSKFLSGATGAANTGKNFTWWDSNTQLDLIFVHQCFARAVRTEYGPRCVIFITHGRQPPQTDQGRALIIHHQFVDRSLLAVHLFLHCDDNLLNPLHSVICLGAGQFNSEGTKHHG